MTVVVRFAVTDPDSSRILCSSTTKYHAADKHDTPSSHLTWGSNPRHGANVLPTWPTYPGRVKSKTEILAPAASLVSVHHLRHRAGLIGQVSV